ncbi:serine hydrolase domain-containing protein [Micromonospora sp. NPDC050397]|uniref:serine hydrolase domain-containing protein n=1 Tax=Micromonospora sp. NPDC050397 TaxID=3364279 RepID=UPI00384D0924
MSDSRRPFPRHPRASRRRRIATTAIALTALTGLALGGALPASGSQTPATVETSVTGDTVRQSLERLVRDDGFPGALAAVRGRDGRTRDLTAGVGDLETGSRVPVDGQVRIASNTKTFVAVVVLQLVGEGRVGLDEPIETYLPGLVHGDGIDGRAITVRQLLQHTSGIPNYTAYIGDDFFALRDRYMEPRELLDLALAHPASFPPGSRWEYSNTNYVLAGLLIQRVTGRPVAEEIDRRIIDRLGLRDTYFPSVGERSIRERHPKGYHPPAPGAPLRDITELDPSWGWAAGQMVGTPSDLNRFFSGLLGGRLLAPAQLAAMRTTVEAPGLWPGARYGLGLSSSPLSCGGVAWGHGGDIPGYETRGGATDDGRAATVAVTALPATDTAHQHVLDVVDTALCR